MPITVEIAETLGVKMNMVGPVRAKLIKKRMLYHTAHGMMALTKRRFNAFTLGALPEFPPLA